MGFDLDFCGAAKNVTGSCYLLSVNGQQLLVDCGFYQERELKNRNWEPFPFAPDKIDAVLLTHGHLDHCGLLPKLVKQGFSGPIYATPATADIAGVVMLDSAKIQTEDVKHKQKRHDREGRKGPYPLAPLYTTEDAEAAFNSFDRRPYDTPFECGEGITAQFYDAGHILGSASIKVSIKDASGTRSILFSGDLGRYDTPIIRDPAELDTVDYVVMESTYGNRTHKPNDGIPDALADVINKTREAGGNVVIPSFAVERTQELLYHLHNLQHDKRIPRLMAFVDSPMAVRVTEIFKKHDNLFDAETVEMLRRGEHPCDFSGLHMSRTRDQSKAINLIRGTSLIIAGSGMCTGGRIKHHLKANISREESTILFIGYQANGTLGRIILEGANSVRIHGEQYHVKANIQKINGFSAHGDRNELLRWVSTLKAPPKKLFVTHGEPEAASAFADLIREKNGWETYVPDYRQPVPLD